jgi:PHD/YefM family antitoxin component YafN of YafNO toxin-antitoxin module
VRTVTATGEPLYLTQNGEARIVVQDIHTYEKTQETLSLLKILALGESEVMKGKTVPAKDAIEAIRQRLES